MARFIIGDLLTGRRILDLPVIAGTWEDPLDTAETITAKVDLNDPEAQSLNLRATTTKGKTFLACVEGKQIVAAGPIWTRQYDRDSRVLSLGAKGMASYFDHRHILPLLAATIPVDQWTIPDPTDNTKRIPNPALSSVYVNVSLGTIAKRLVQQAQTWTGGNVPVIFQPDEADDDPTHTKTYLGADFKPVTEAHKDLTNMIDGPETNYQAVFTDDQKGLVWSFQVGTKAQPLLFNAERQVWDATVSKSPVSKLTTDEDGSKMGSYAWQTGGGQSGDVMVARAYDDTLVASGYPLMELLDSSHTSVSVQSTLDAYAQTQVLMGRNATETWSFEVDAYPTDDDGYPAGPQADAYTTGDFADLILHEFDPVSGRGDPYFPGGTNSLRITSRSGDEKSETIKIATAPILGSL